MISSSFSKMTDISKLSFALTVLENALRKSKNPAADYYKSLRIRIEQNVVERCKIIEEEIVHSAAVIQYANFSYDEEKLFKELWRAAHEYLES